MSDDEESVAFFGISLRRNRNVSSNHDPFFIWAQLKTVAATNRLLCHLPLSLQPNFSIFTFSMEK
jgi:hypothetical protein